MEGKPSARRVRRAGPQRAGEEAEQKSTKNENRSEIKSMNTTRKIPDLEPTQSRCKLEIFRLNLNNVYIQSAEVSALPPSF
jgi:hypothetical protein